MKIVITVEVNVDPEAWNTTYGSRSRPSEVRRDVREYVLEQIRGSAAAEECGLKAILRTRPS